MNTQPIHEYKQTEGIMIALMQKLGALTPPTPVNTNTKNTTPLKQIFTHETNAALKLYNKQSLLSGAFNISNENGILHKTLLSAFLKNKAARAGLEKWIYHYKRRLFALQKQASYAPAF